MKDFDVDAAFVALVARYATDSLREVRALTDVLVEKGLVTRDEVDERINQNHNPGIDLEAILDAS
jgi:DNA polymerase III gamma/tau subunit